MKKAVKKAPASESPFQHELKRARRRMLEIMNVPLSDLEGLEARGVIAPSGTRSFLEWPTAG